MTTPSRGVLFISLILVIVLPSSGQITITSSDVNASLAPGSTITSMVDTATHTADIGALGSASWDFSTLVNNFSAVTVGVRADTTGYFSRYPQATHAIQTGTGYTYYKLATDLEFLGYAQPPPTEVITRDIPAHIIEKLPLTMGTSWTATYAESSYVTISGTVYTTVTNHVVDYTVDASGSLTLPGGSVHQALRLKSDRHASTNLFSFRSITYQFLTREGAAVTVVPADTNQPQTGPISVSTISWNLAGPATSVGETPAGDVPSGFRLDQNYPNPFNPSTMIRFSLPRTAFVSLKVFDLSGQEVATLVSEERAQGTYFVQWDGSGLASGVYVCRLRSGPSVETRKLVLMR